MQNPNQMPKQEQMNILNRIHTALGLLKIDGAQAELLVELRKGVAVVNNAIHVELQESQVVPPPPLGLVENNINGAAQAA